MKKYETVLIIFLNFQISTLSYAAHVADHENEYGKLIHVSVLFRHGDRSPIHPYPTDPYKHFPWPAGHGQLTKAGEGRMYDVGKWYKRRYSKLVKQIRSHRNVTVRSSNRSRAIMSAQCFVAGFYPMKRNRFLNQLRHWRPIPIHTVPRKYDNMLVVSEKNECPLKKYYEEKCFNGESVKKLYDKHRKTFDFLRNHTGYNFSRQNMVRTSGEVDHVYDTLLVENENNFTLPSWTQKVFPRPLLTLKEDFSLEHKTTTLYPKMKRLMAGPFLASITSNMMKKSRKSKEIFHLYSSHDTMIRYVSVVLNFNNTVAIPYGSSFMFELRRKNKEHTVSIFYANSTTAAPYPVPLPQCETPCTLQKFIEFTRPFIPVNWKSECQLNQKDETTNADVAK